ncbi:MAG: GNAT family N-acetyltransferase [Chloroflexota bacterium]
MNIKVEYLADHPELVSLLAAWFYEEWGQGSPAVTFERMEERVRARMNRDHLPLALVALDNGVPVGSATLKIQEMETHPQFLYWLGTVYVRPPFRRQGIGSIIVEAATAEAARLGLGELYLYTRHSERFYTRLGWVVVERVFYHGREADIMKYAL